jgi:hypothetical protein
MTARNFHQVRIDAKTLPPLPPYDDHPELHESQAEIYFNQPASQMRQYEATELDVDEFLLKMDPERQPTREEAKAFLTMYVNGGLDGLTEGEVVEKLKATGEAFIETIRAEWARLSPGVKLTRNNAQYAAVNQAARGPFRQAESTKKKGPKVNARRAKNRIAKATRKKQRKRS